MPNKWSPSYLTLQGRFCSNGLSPLARFRFAATPPAVSNKLVAPSHNGAPVQPVTTSSSCSNASRVPSKGISPALIAERKQKGLCFWCGAKYHIGRKCVKAQLHQMLLESHSDAEGDDFQECSDQLEDPLVESEPSQEPILSLHAIKGSY
ncbi:hypothetical protein PVK06_029889 [Gossypium arboreum]|uniref:Uncharacterized protein n=1 Tax=Gossypium arboreum TaxID=29729 RepID=A0ABR0NLU2_GOSAR|nr:hypothetical protein PVK06_029889 [Gossypium arboreum]